MTQAVLKDKSLAVFVRTQVVLSKRHHTYDPSVQFVISTFDVYIAGTPFTADVCFLVTSIAAPITNTFFLLLLLFLIKADCRALKSISEQKPSFCLVKAEKYYSGILLRLQRLSRETH